MSPVISSSVRVVLDTSVLVTAVRSRNGAAAEVLRLAISGAIRPLLDLKLALEYRDVLLRKEHLLASGLSRCTMAYLIDQFEGIAEPVEIVRGYRPLSSDPGDDMILELAINGLADAIATNNIRHLRRAAGPFDIQVVTPRELLLQLMREGA